MTSLQTKNSFRDRCKESVVAVESNIVSVNLLLIDNLKKTTIANNMITIANDMIFISFRKVLGRLQTDASNFHLRSRDQVCNCSLCFSTLSFLLHLILVFI